jgi:uncharacterized protein YecE (DUF72 family)
VSSDVKTEDKLRRENALPRIGTAGWSMPREDAADAAAGTHLERYAARFSAVEINSSFHRTHRASTYARWSASVPAGFRFSVKLPRAITHTARLQDADELLAAFLDSIAPLGEVLGCLLIQLPPSLEFETPIAERFFTGLRERYPGAAACEPRHASWLQPRVEDMLATLRIARVAADPDRPTGAGEPGGWPDLVYRRLHGSPRMYHSSYPPAFLERLADRIIAECAEGREVWCIFDNTAAGAALENAMELERRLSGGAHR